MICEEGDKILPGFAMRTNEFRFDFFTMVENATEFADISPTFHDICNFKEKRVIKGGIDTESGLIRTVASHKFGNCFLRIVDFAEREKVPFPERLSKFSNCVAEDFNHWGRYMFRRVNTEAIKIKFRDEVLVGMDQNIQHWSGAIPRSEHRPLAARTRIIFNYQLSLFNEIAFHEALR